MVFVTTTIGIWCHEQLPEIHYSVSDLQRRLEVSVIFGPNSTRIISLRSPDSSRPHRKSTPTADQRQSGTLLRSAVNSRSLCFHRLLMTQRKSFLYATNCQADLLIARVVGHFVYLTATGPIWVLCDQLNGPMLKNVFVTIESSVNCGKILNCARHAVEPLFLSHFLSDLLQKNQNCKFFI